MPTLDQLTEPELRRLYLEEGVPDSEIAERYGTYQVKINRLRAKFGIQTVLKSDRLDLPFDLTSRQKSLLIGSMLGDAGLRPTGESTARMMEHHSLSQRDYLDWKVSEWSVFVSKIVSGDKGDHKGFRFYTHGCRALFPFWQRFYPEGRGEKTCVNLDPEEVDDFALAVWFMDDGSRAGNYVRFSVSPDAANQRAQLRILKRFGLTGVLYSYGARDKSDCSIHLQDRTNLNRFLDLVRPHMHSSMTYKLDFKVQPQSGPAPRHLLTKETLEPLIQRGLPAGPIADLLNVSRQSVLRALDRHGFPKRAPGRPGAGTRTEFEPQEADEQLKSLDRSAESFLDEAVGILSRTTFPLYPPTDDQVAHDIELLRRAPTTLKEGAITGVTKAGSTVCAKFFTHRWDARYRDQPSLRLAWYDEKVLRQAIRFQVRVGDPVTTARVCRAVQVVVRAPTNFRPCFAKVLVEHFCPEGGLVLDPCAGYGGRASGTLAAKRQYFGIDPHPDAETAHRSLALAMGADIGFINAPFEDADLGGMQADLILTSPPYFSVERYSDDPTQSWVRYPTWESWVLGFLGPFTQKCWAHAKEGAILCVNTKDIRVGRKILPIGQELVRLATSVGFEPKPALSLPIGRIGKNVQSEPIFVFQKPISS